MKRILLTSTALVMAAGVATAETSISWSGTATAGMARTGKIIGVTAGGTTVNLDSIALDVEAAMDLATSTAAKAMAAGSTAALIKTTIATYRAEAVSAKLAQDTLVAALATLSASTSHARVISALDAVTANLSALTSLDTTEAATGDFETYSEVSTTVTGSVSADNGMTFTAAVSVDAGTGYDFADDDGFDAAKTNGVSLDNVTISTGMGTIKIDQNAVTHLVDGDDDGSADILYTNTFGSVSFSAAMDVSTDVDDNAVKASAAVITHSGGVASAGSFTLTSAAVAAVAADVQWSAKVSMPVSGGTAYVAMDEEGGNAFGVSSTVGGIGVSFDSKLEALEEGLSMDRSNTIAMTYVMGTVTAGASWNSIEDKDQWGISAAYAADGMTISASTDEGSDWAVSGSVALGGGATAVAGVNYTEDAYLGLSFAF